MNARQMKSELMLSYIHTDSLNKNHQAKQQFRSNLHRFALYFCQLAPRDNYFLPTSAKVGLRVD